VTNVPASGTTVRLDAQPWAGFAFMYWTIHRTNGSSYRDYNSVLVRTGLTNDYSYFAEFIGQ
jgi:hypothetical protein